MTKRRLVGLCAFVFLAFLMGDLTRAHFSGSPTSDVIVERAINTAGALLALIFCACEFWGEP